MNQIQEKSKPRVSIIIPVYNSGKTLSDTLRSVTGQDHPSFETLVVDDASTDNSAEIALEYGAKVIRLESNRGPATARNEGAQQAAGDILLFTDSDVLLPRNSLQIMEARFSGSGADAVQGVFSDVCPYAEFFSQYKNLYNRYVLNRLPDWIDTTFTSVTAVRREAFLACGGFDDGIRTPSVEDRTLGRNLVRHKFRICMDRALQVIHNKKLTFQGFLRNQFRRSRDLAKLLLRMRSEPEPPQAEKISPIDESGRFGTNAPSTMARIPVAYLLVLFLLLSLRVPVFGILVVLLGLLYLYLIAPFEWYLFRKKGLQFALLGVWANIMDALVSGAGVLIGLVEYKWLGRRY